MARQKGDEGLLVRFYRTMEPNQERSKLTGKPEFDEVECISIIVPGSRDEHVAIVNDDYRARFGDEYAEWKKRDGAPINGTPLEEWTHASRSFVEEMKTFGVRSVEDLAGLPDVMAMRSPSVMTMKAKAVAWLETAGTEGVAVALAAENEDLKAQIAALQAQLAPKPRKAKAVVDPSTMTDEELEEATRPAA
jgi:hypothetical protein